MFVVPFLGYHHRLPIPSFVGEWMAAVLGLLAFVPLLRKSSWQSIGLPAIALVPLGLTVILLVQIPLGLVVFPEHSILGASYLLWAMALMMLGSFLRREVGWGEVVETLAWFLLVGGMLNAAMGVLQHFKIPSLFDPFILKTSRVVFANMAQPNHFSDYIGLAVCSTLYLFAKRRLSLILALPLGVLLLLAFSFSGSRSTWVYLGVLVVLSLYFSRANNSGNKVIAYGAILLVPGFILAQYVSSILSATIVTPTDNLFNLAGSKSDRLALWREAWQMFLGAPLLGVGFGEFTWHHVMASREAPDVIRGGLYNHAHNIIVHLLAEMGIFAGLMVMLGVWFWMFRVLRDGRSLENWWLLAVVGILGVHSMLEYPLWYAYFLGIAATLLGAGEHRLIRLDMQKIGHRVFLAVVSMGCVSLGNLAYSYSSLEANLYSRSDELFSEKGSKEFVNSLMRIHRDSLLSNYVEMAFTRGIELNREKMHVKLEVNGRAMHYAPLNETVYRQALLLGLNGDIDEAKRMLDIAVAAYPRDLTDVVKLMRLRSVNEPAFRPLLDYAESRLVITPSAVSAVTTVSAIGSDRP